MTSWLATAEGVVVSDPVAVFIGGLEGTMTDLTMDPVWTRTCPFSEGIPVRPLFASTRPEAGIHWVLGPEAHARVCLIDRGDGTAMLIDVEEQDEESFQAMLGEATGIIEPLDFARPITEP